MNNFTLFLVYFTRVKFNLLNFWNALTTFKYDSDIKIINLVINLINNLAKVSRAYFSIVFIVFLLASIEFSDFQVNLLIFTMSASKVFTNQLDN